ncbi:hypothetical protein, partial [Serratia rubidaea]|uniref:hypothetical protein n=1 Tax=Serratia rubidaea TaxID=61652 RepID=UPI001F206C38
DYKSVALPTELSRHQVQRILGRERGLCNKKIAFCVLSLTKQPIFAFCSGFSSLRAQITIKCHDHSL